MRERIRAALERVAQSAPMESAWLRTLSLLEYTGARKIGRTAAAHHPSLEVLQHWSDETRHAALFLGLAVALNGGETPPYLCGDEARVYFHDLDQALSRWTQERSRGADPFVDYLLVTTIVERRAMILYPLYRATSRDPRVRDEVSRVIVEEQSHRLAIEAQCRARLLSDGAGAASDEPGAGGEGGHGRGPDFGPAFDFAEPMALEESLFDRFWTALEERLLSERWSRRTASSPVPTVTEAGSR